MAAKKPENMPFEAAIGELKSIVEAMEQGDLSLDDALKHFERGIQLARAGQQKLENAEQRVQMLVQDSSLTPNANGEQTNLDADFAPFTPHQE